MIIPEQTLYEDLQMEHSDVTILIVDDQPTTLKMLCAFLQSQGFKVVVAENGEQTLEFLRHEQPDLILLDVLMPGLNGFDLCRKIKENKDTAQIPIIFMTGLDSVKDKVAGFEAGGVDYITKPFQRVEVLARVKTHVMLRHREKQLEEANKKLSQQHKILEVMSITDGLTGLYNRRHMNTVLSQEVQRCRRYGTDLACLVIDLDQFKLVNDTYGHDFGDLVLHEFSRRLRDSLRSSDFAFRFGGEEFLLLLPQTNMHDARRTAEKIRQYAATKKIGDDKTHVVVTVSIGLATFNEHQPVIQNDLVIFADKALYRAKAEGRNQVVEYSSSFK